MPASTPGRRRRPADSLLSRPSASPGIMLTDGSAASVGIILEDEDISASPAGMLLVGRPAAGPSAVELRSVGSGAGPTSLFFSEGAVGRGGGSGFRVVDDTSVDGLGRGLTTGSDSVAPSSVGRGRGRWIVENPEDPAALVDETAGTMVKKPPAAGLSTGLVGCAEPLSPSSPDSSSEIGDSCLLSCPTRPSLAIGTSPAPPSWRVATLSRWRIECLLSLFLRSSVSWMTCYQCVDAENLPQRCAVYHGCDPLGHCARQMLNSTRGGTWNTDRSK